MAGYNSNEGRLFADPSIQDQNAYQNFLRQFLPPTSSNIIKYISEELYPADFSGKYGYTNETGRLALTVGEAQIACNPNLLARAYSNQTYNYLFNVAPGLHIMDTTYTFSNGEGFDSTYGFRLDKEISQTLQSYIVQFALHGDPNDADGVTQFDEYGQGANIQVLGPSSVLSEVDPAANARYDWWQQVKFDGEY